MNNTVIDVDDIFMRIGFIKSGNGHILSFL